MPRIRLSHLARSAHLGQRTKVFGTRPIWHRPLRIEPLERRELMASRLFGVMLDNPNLIREFDPTTGTILNSFAAPIAHPNQGLAFDGSRLFYSVADGEGRIWELNPASGAVLDLDTVAGGTGNFDGLALLHGKLYIQDRVSNQILVFDPDADSILATLDVAADLSGGLTGASEPDELIAQAGSQILRIGPTSGAILGTFEVPVALEGIAFVGNELCFASPGVPNIGRFSRDGEGLGVISVPGGFPLAALGSDAPSTAVSPVSSPRLFAASTDTQEHLVQILELDPATGQVMHSIPAPKALGPINAAAQIGLAFAGGNLFVLDGAGSNLLFELDPDTGAIVDQDLITAIDEVDGLALIGAIAYIQDHAADKIIAFDTVTDVVLATFSPGVNLLGGFAAAKNPPALLAVVDGSGPDTIVELNPQTGAVTNSFELADFPVPTLGLAVLGHEVYVGAGRTNAIGRYSRSGILLGTLTPPFPVNALGGDAFGRADTPRVTGGSTLEDTLSGPLTIEPASQGSAAVSHFRISGITGGALFKQDGVTPVTNGSFITVAEGQAGLRFEPTPDSNAAGRFVAEASLDGVMVSSEGDPALGTIQIIPSGDTPSVANAITVEDTLSNSIVIQRHAADGPEVAHFRISGIAGGALFQADGTTPIPNGSFVTAAQAQAGVRFLPAPDSIAPGKFDVEASPDGVSVAVQSGKATSMIAVTPLNDPPEFTAAHGTWLTNLDTGEVRLAGYVTAQSAGPADEAEQALGFEVTIESTTGNLGFINPPIVDLASGRLSYTPLPGTSGTATLSIRLVDDGPTGSGHRNASEPQSLVVNVAAQLPNLQLPATSVIENQMGAVVGPVTVSGGTAGSSYAWFVSDPRFEVQEGQLQLKSDEHVVLAAGETRNLSLLFDDGVGQAFVKSVPISVASNAYPWHKMQLPEDADGNDTRNLQDAIFIIRQLRRGLGGPLPLPRPLPSGGGHFGDVVADNKLDVLDAIGVIRYLRRAERGSEGELTQNFGDERASASATPAWDLALLALSDEQSQKKRGALGRAVGR